MIMERFICDNFHFAVEFNGGVIVPAKNLTVYIPQDIANEMDRFPEVNWSKIAQEAIQTYIRNRLDTSLPFEAIKRLKKEKGEEFANGKRYAIEEIIPNTSYDELDSFFRSINDEAERVRSDWAQAEGVPKVLFKLEPFYDKVAPEVTRRFFGLKNCTDEFIKGIIMVLEETWEKLKEQ